MIQTLIEVSIHSIELEGSVKMDYVTEEKKKTSQTSFRNKNFNFNWNNFFSPPPPTILKWLTFQSAIF